MAILMCSPIPDMQDGVCGLFPGLVNIHLLAPHWMVCQVILEARLLPNPPRIPPALGATPTILPPQVPYSAPNLPGCTSSIACFSALPVAQVVIPFPISVLRLKSD
jgi:hypothetical protein